MNWKVLVVLAILIIVVGGVLVRNMASQKQPSEKLIPKNSPTKPLPQNTQELQGVVKFTDLEGGCWYLLVDSAIQSAVKYELIGVEKSLLEQYHDKKVKIQGKIRSDMASVCQIGTIFEAEKITPF